MLEGGGVDGTHDLQTPNPSPVTTGIDRKSTSSVKLTILTTERGNKLLKYRATLLFHFPQRQKKEVYRIASPI